MIALGVCLLLAGLSLLGWIVWDMAHEEEEIPIVEQKRKAWQKPAAPGVHRRRVG